MTSFALEDLAPMGITARTPTGDRGIKSIELKVVFGYHLCVNLD